MHHWTTIPLCIQPQRADLWGGILAHSWFKCCDLVMVPAQWLQQQHWYTSWILNVRVAKAPLGDAMQKEPHQGQGWRCWDGSQKWQLGQGCHFVVPSTHLCCLVHILSMVGGRWWLVASAHLIPWQYSYLSILHTSLGQNLVSRVWWTLQVKNQTRKLWWGMQKTAASRGSERSRCLWILLMMAEVNGLRLAHLEVGGASCATAVSVVLIRVSFMFHESPCSVCHACTP